MNDLISVIMPAYNVEKYIAKSIESVLSQTYENLELIIINDGSSDGTENIILHYKKMDSRIQYIKQENQGVSVARNNGIDIANGIYISFLDADDLWDNKALEKLYALMKSNSENKFVYGRTVEKFLSGKMELVGPKGAINGFLEDYIHTSNELRLRSNTIALLINRELLNKYSIRFPVGIKLSEDTYFLIKLLCVTKAVGMNDIIAFYMRRDDSATTVVWKPERWRGHVEIYILLEEFIRLHRKNALPAFCAMRNYVAYRFILTCIRKGCIGQAQNDILEWKLYLHQFVSGNGKFFDRLKCRCIMLFKNNQFILKMLGKI